MKNNQKSPSETMKKAKELYEILDKYPAYPAPRVVKRRRDPGDDVYHIATRDTNESIELIHYE